MKPALSSPALRRAPRPRHRPRALNGLAATAAAGCLRRRWSRAAARATAGGTSADPATAVPASAALYAGATVRPTGSLQTASALAAGKRPHPPGGPLPAAARGVADAGLAHAELQPRRGALARALRGRVPDLAARLQHAALAARARPARRRLAGSVPVRHGRRRRRARARHQQPGKGTLVPRLPGRARRRPHDQLPRRLTTSSAPAAWRSGWSTTSPSSAASRGCGA